MKVGSNHAYGWKKGVAINALLAGIFPSFHALIANGVPASELTMEFLTSLAYSLTIGGMCHFIMPKVGGWAKHRPPLLSWSVIGLTLVSIAAVGTFFATWLLAEAGVYPEGAFWHYYLRAFQVGAVITVIFGFSIGLYKSLWWRLEETTLQLRTQELERERALKLASEARLSSLESRVHPHFLFNTLNSISSLIREDPQRAEQLIERMSALLRFSLDSTQTGLVPLHLEMKIVNDYLEIERARFGDRLRFEVAIPAGFDHVEVPPLSIQTLVENSVKYAVSPRREGGLIRVAAAKTGDRIVLEVWDDGPGFAVDAIVAGHGLDNLQARLLNTFGMDAALGMTRRDTGMLVTIALPQLRPQLAPQ